MWPPVAWADYEDYPEILQAHWHTHTLDAHSHVGSHTFTHMCTHRHTHLHTNTPAHAYSCSHTHTLAHPCPHTHSYTHTGTHSRPALPSRHRTALGCWDREMVPWESPASSRRHPRIQVCICQHFVRKGAHPQRGTRGTFVTR